MNTDTTAMQEFLDIISRRQQEEIARFYNNEESAEEKQKRQIIIDVYSDLLTDGKLILHGYNPDELAKRGVDFVKGLIEKHNNP